MDGFEPLVADLDSFGVDEIEGTHLAMGVSIAASYEPGFEEPAWPRLQPLKWKPSSMHG